jgi:predicted oxidoreductase
VERGAVLRVRGRALLSGTPADVDGRMLETPQSSGAHVVNPDRMWHYTEGVGNSNPI